MPTDSYSCLVTTRRYLILKVKSYAAKQSFAVRLNLNEI